MPTITVTVEIPWLKGRLTLAKLERATHGAAMAAGRTAQGRAGGGSP